MIGQMNVDVAQNHHCGSVVRKYTRVKASSSDRGEYEQIKNAIALQRFLEKLVQLYFMDFVTIKPYQEIEY